MIQIAIWIHWKYKLSFTKLNSELLYGYDKISASNLNICNDIPTRSSRSELDPSEISDLMRLNVWIYRAHELSQNFSLTMWPQIHGGRLHSQVFRVSNYPGTVAFRCNDINWAALAEVCSQVLCVTNKTSIMCLQNTFVATQKVKLYSQHSAALIIMWGAAI